MGNTVDNQINCFPLLLVCRRVSEKESLYFHYFLLAQIKQTRAQYSPNNQIYLARPRLQIQSPD